MVVVAAVRRQQPRNPREESRLLVGAADGRGALDVCRARARRWTAVFVAVTVVSLMLLAVGLVVELWWDRGAHHRHMSGFGWFFFGGFAALYAFAAWRHKRLLRKVDEAAKGAPESWS
jgi:hypothetical protein